MQRDYIKGNLQKNVEMIPEKLEKIKSPDKYDANPNYGKVPK